MVGSPCIQCRVDPTIKARLATLAQQHQLTESALLKRIVETALVPLPGLTETESLAPVSPVSPVPRGARLYVRLRPEDHLLLRERAGARGMAGATYASMVLRAHLRSVAPLPDRELAELKRAVGALGMIGRNLNQLARIANQTRQVTGPSIADLHAVLRALEGLRDHVRAVVRANIASWETGNDETGR